MDCVRILREHEDYEQAFDKLLEMVASFYRADRSYIFEFDLEAERLSNTYQIKVVPWHPGPSPARSCWGPQHRGDGAGGGTPAAAFAGGPGPG